MNLREVMEQVIWQNVHIRIQGKTVVRDHWIDRNIMYMYDLYDDDRIHAKSAEELGVNWLE